MAKKIAEDPPDLATGQRVAITIREIHSGPKGDKGEKGEQGISPNVSQIIFSNPPAGSYQIKNIYLKDGKIIMEYEDTL